MVYEKPKLIDLNEQSEKGHGQARLCAVGSGALGMCQNGSTAGVGCGMGSGGLAT